MDRIVTIVLLSTLASCGQASSEPVTPGSALKDEAEARLRASLPDPANAKLDNVFAHPAAFGGKGSVCGKVQGGEGPDVLTGYRRFVVTSSTVFVDRDPAVVEGFNVVWREAD